MLVIDVKKKNLKLQICTYVFAADQRMASAGFLLTGKQHFFERRAAQFLVFTGQLLRH